MASIINNVRLTLTNTDGGENTTLEHYEEYEHEARWEGPFATNQSNIYIVRCGRMVTLHVKDALVQAYNGNPSQIFIIEHLPQRFRPEKNVQHAIMVWENGDSAGGVLTVNRHSGAIGIDSALSGGKFQGPGKVGFGAWTVSYFGQKVY